jgi:hypothetical protein
MAGMTPTAGVELQSSPDWQSAKAVCKRMLLPPRNIFTGIFESHLRALQNIFVRQPMRYGYIVPSSPELNIAAIGIGYKVVRGERTWQKCVRVYVRKKLPRSAFESSSHMIPTTVEGFPTDVIETGSFTALSTSSASRTAAIQPGCSIGFSVRGMSMAGTLGAIVSDESGRRFFLSNNHVLCFEDRLAAGTPILQPGSADGGLEPVDVVGTFLKATPLRTIFRDEDRMDAAVATINDGCPIDPEILWLGRRLASGEPTQPDLLLEHPVTKSGRSTRLTHGRIVDISIDPFVDYYAETLHLTGMLGIESTGDNLPFAEIGDSGSLVVSENMHQPVGLVVASADSKMVVAHPIGAVLSRLGVKMVI